VGRDYPVPVDEIGLFPLGVVLLPTERIPLHVFEPRYKELIGECIAEGREFGLVLTDDDGLREIGTRAAVVEVLEQFEDGRMNVLVEGRERFRLVGLTEGRSFATGEVEPVEDERADADEGSVARAIELLRRVGRLAGAEVDTIEVASDSPSFELAARVEFEPKLKQQLLELRSEPARLGRLSQLLERAARSLELQRERSEIASRNGKPPRR
jgi:Lon protease-like protein